MVLVELLYVNRGDGKSFNSMPSNDRRFWGGSSSVYESWNARFLAYQSSARISRRLDIVMCCVVWFLCGLQKIHMSFQSFLLLMHLSTMSCSQCLLVPLWGVFQWNYPHLSSPSSWIAASSSSRSSSLLHQPGLISDRDFFSLSESLPLPSLFFPEALTVLLILTLFALNLLLAFVLSFFSYCCDIVVVVVLLC